MHDQGVVDRRHRLDPLGDEQHLLLFEGHRLVDADPCGKIFHRLGHRPFEEVDQQPRPEFLLVDQLLERLLEAPEIGRGRAGLDGHVDLADRAVGSDLDLHGVEGVGFALRKDLHLVELADLQVLVEDRGVVGELHRLVIGELLPFGALPLPFHRLDVEEVEIEGGGGDLVARRDVQQLLRDILRAHDNGTDRLNGAALGRLLFLHKKHRLDPPQTNLKRAASDGTQGRF